MAPWHNADEPALQARRRGPAGFGVLGAVLLAVALGGCSGGGMPKLTDLNPFKEKQKRLPGERVAILTSAEKLPGEMAVAGQPIGLPAQRANANWTQPGGEPNNAPGHLVLKEVVRASFKADIGAGSSKSGRLLASPIVYDGRVYTLDAASSVTAFSASGSRVWRVTLAPAKEKASEGFGGGVAADNGRIYAATGHGYAFALDPRTGKKLWEKKLGIPVRSSPTAAGDKLFVLGIDGKFFCLNGADGSEAWSYRGLPHASQFLNNVSPSVADGLVVVPYPNGDLVALNVADGSSAWSESLARTRQMSSLSSMADPGRPAFEGGVVYGVGHAGRMIATNAKSGERLWTINLRSVQTPWVAGDNIFVVDTSGVLYGLGKRDGKIRWQVRLPGSKTWSGPVLAGNRLWLASNKGKLVGVEPVVGRVASQQDLGGAIYIAPVVAGGRMYVLNDSGNLVGLN